MIRGVAHDAHVTSIVELCCTLTRAGVAFVRQGLSHESIITRARNEIATRFLASDCTCLLMIDADIGFATIDAGNQCRVTSSGALDLVVAPYRKRTPPYEWTVRRFPPERPARWAQDHGTRFLEVSHGGGGFMALSRRLVERFAQDAKHYRGGTPAAPLFPAYRIFETRLSDELEDLGEDFDLCERWRTLYGGSVWCNVDARLVHMGETAIAGTYDAERAARAMPVQVASGALPERENEPESGTRRDELERDGSNGRAPAASDGSAARP